MSVPISPYHVKSGAQEPPEDHSCDQEAPEHNACDDEESTEAYENR
jgi:hypothetical protein